MLLLTLGLDELLKRHTCSVCGKGFTRSDLLSRHGRIHMGSSRSRTTSKNRPGSEQQDTRATELSLLHNSNLDDLEDGADNSIVQSSVSTLPSVAFLSSIETLSRVDPGVATTNTSIHTITTHNSIYHPLDNSSLTPDPIAVENPDMQLDLLGGQDLLLQDWFDHNFYEALRETDTFWPLNRDGWDHDISTGIDIPMPDVISLPSYGNTRETRSVVRMNSPVPVSRISSPPNEASEEDRWPFTWDPRSRRILNAQTIVITEDHQLQLEHRPRFDITDVKYDSVKRFWQIPRDHGMGTFSVEMPTLRTANILIGLFFSHFEPRMPVIHRPSLQRTDNLPDVLIAAMIVIGAICSRQRHSTRFAIVLLDMTRIAAQITMESDNSLMRDAMYIYATGLICFVGLWCGNKRAFELAELSRAAVVNFCRRSHFASTSPSQRHRDPNSDQPSGTDIGVHWARWIDRETKKRLCWVVYGIDCEAAILLRIPPTLSISEICKLECPCDEEFWHASSARRWKRLLGLAPFPASRALSCALAPFLQLLYSKNAERHEGFAKAGRALTGLNAWSRLLVLQALQLSIYTLSEDIAVITSADLTDSDSGDDEIESGLNPTLYSKPLGDTQRSDLESHGIAPQRIQPSVDISKGKDTSGTNRSGMSNTIQALSTRKTQLEAMLSSWSHTCLSTPPPDTTIYATSEYFYNAAISHYSLALLSLNVQIVDLQDSLGKSGSVEMAVALQRLSQIYENDMAQTTAMVLHCKKIAEFGVSERTVTVCAGPESDCYPEDFIGLFLSYVYMWTVAMTASAELKSRILAAMSSTADTAQRKISSVLQHALSPEDDSLQAINEVRNGQALDQASRSDRNARPTIILRSGAEALSQLRPLGACLNLALLLHQRAKMS